jgi:hypothetical protein
MEHRHLEVRLEFLQRPPLALPNVGYRSGVFVVIETEDDTSESGVAKEGDLIVGDVAPEYSQSKGSQVNGIEESFDEDTVSKSFRFLIGMQTIQKPADGTPFGV